MSTRDLSESLSKVEEDTDEEIKTGDNTEISNEEENEAEAEDFENEAEAEDLENEAEAEDLENDDHESIDYNSGAYIAHKTKVVLDETKIPPLQFRRCRWSSDVPPKLFFPYPPVLVELGCETRPDKAQRCSATGGSLTSPVGVIAPVPPKKDDGEIQTEPDRKQKGIMMKYWCHWERNAVKRAFYYAGLVRTKDKRKASILWCKHMKSATFRKQVNRPWQKINHIPGTWQMGRKDCLARSVMNFRHKFGKIFNIHPQSYVYPRDSKEFCRAVKDFKEFKYVIKKPAASSRGRGIKVLTAKTAVSLVKKMDTKNKKTKQYIFQEYIARPFLINNLKFDLRVYVLCTSFDPLTIYLFDDGLVRFCTKPYKLSGSSIKHKYGHLTNYSLNKKSVVFQENITGSIDEMQGHKWGLKGLWKYFKENDIDTNTVKQDIEDVIVKTFICIEDHVNSQIVRMINKKCAASCFELFGFDLMLDSDLKPWLIEVNISPSLMGNSPMDERIKGTLISDTLHLIGITKPEKYDKKQKEKLSKQSTIASKANAASATRRDWVLRKARIGAVPKLPSATSHGRSKKTFNSSRERPNRISIKQLEATPMEHIAKGDMKKILEIEDELSRRGHFHRIYPTHSRCKTLSKYFTAQRYNNILIAKWLEYCDVHKRNSVQRMARQMSARRKKKEKQEKQKKQRKQINKIVKNTEEYMPLSITTTCNSMATHKTNNVTESSDFIVTQPSFNSQYSPYGLAIRSLARM